MRQEFTYYLAEFSCLVFRRNWKISNALCSLLLWLICIFQNSADYFTVWKRNCLSNFKLQCCFIKSSPLETALISLLCYRLMSYSKKLTTGKTNLEGRIKAKPVVRLLKCPIKYKCILNYTGQSLASFQWE